MKKNRQTALILAIVLGWIGADKLYLGEKSVGCLYFFTFGLFGIGWAWSIYTLWSMTDEEFDEKYNQKRTSGGSTMNANMTSNNNNVINIQGMTQPQQTSATDELKKLYELKERGIITQEEFEQRKKFL